MTHSGYRWILRPEGGHWRWMAVGRDDQAILAEGPARTRAEGAAFLARTMSLGVLTDQERLAV